MKRVFSTIEDCIHAYAQFSQDQGKSGNVFFYRNTLYSYGHHFPLAHKTQNAKGEMAYCVTYCGAHPMAGTTELNLHGETFKVNPA